MTDLIKKGNGMELAEWNPMRTFRDLLRWDPFREMAPMIAWNPGFDVTENKEAYLFKADIPGVKKEDIEITTVGNRIQITGKRDAEHETKTDTVYAYERQYGAFTRVFTLPEGADFEHAKSELKEGVLTLVVPKLAGAAVKKIPVGVAGPKA